MSSSTFNREMIRLGILAAIATMLGVYRIGEAWGNHVERKYNQQQMGQYYNQPMAYPRRHPRFYPRPYAY